MLTDVLTTVECISSSTSSTHRNQTNLQVTSKSEKMWDSGACSIPLTTNFQMSPHLKEQPQMKREHSKVPAEILRSVSVSRHRVNLNLKMNCGCTRKQSKISERQIEQRWSVVQNSGRLYHETWRNHIISYYLSHDILLSTIVTIYSTHSIIITIPPRYHRRRTFVHKLY